MLAVVKKELWELLGKWNCDCCDFVLFILPSFFNKPMLEVFIPLGNINAKKFNKQNFEAPCRKNIKA